MKASEQKLMAQENNEWLAKQGLTLKFSTLSIKGMVYGEVVSALDGRLFEFTYQVEEYIPQKYFQMIIRTALNHHALGFREGWADLKSQTQDFFRDTLGLAVIHHEH